MKPTTATLGSLPHLQRQCTPPKLSQEEVLAAVTQGSIQLTIKQLCPAIMQVPHPGPPDDGVEIGGELGVVFSVGGDVGCGVGSLVGAGNDAFGTGISLTAPPPQ
mmetsp:Transcript_7687/g.20967  ORF Transcript_7687/g.20967 Transcript_7687/m.20967 type:complete len:105 (+) Transcript_7687:54-368(+)